MPYQPLDLGELSNLEWYVLNTCESPKNESYNDNKTKHNKPKQNDMHIHSWGVLFMQILFKKAYELLNLKTLKFS